MSGEDALGKQSPEWTAVLKLLYSLTEYEMRAHEAEDGPHIIQVAAEASATLEELQARVAEVEAIVDTDLQAMDYEQLTRKDKVRAVQAALLEEAEDSSTDKASFDYQDVLWLFNRQPSKGHCYDLMKLAGEASGFEYQERSGTNQNRLCVDLNNVNETAAVRRVNTPREAESS